MAVRASCGRAFMLIFILAESALELVPKQLARHPQIVRNASRKEKKTDEILLDRSYHHAAMRLLEGGEKRGRPDIVHVTLLEVLGTPLNSEGLLQLYVHTSDDHVITVDPSTRLPRNYDRFVGLMEQLYSSKSVPENRRPLLKIRKLSLEKLLDEVKPTKVTAFSTAGKTAALRDICAKLASESKPAVIVGGFAKGHFSRKTLSLADEVYCISRRSLDASIVASRIIYEYELAVGV